MRQVTLTLVYSVEDSVTDETITEFHSFIENEVAKRSYDLDSIDQDIDGEYIAEDACPHDWQYKKGNDEVALYRCRLCHAEHLE